MRARPGEGGGAFSMVVGERTLTIASEVSAADIPDSGTAIGAAVTEATEAYLSDGERRSVSLPADVAGFLDRDFEMAPPECCLPPRDER